jgi:hypothetical protein
MDKMIPDIAQAKALKAQASDGGLCFEVYLPSGLAEWILDLVEHGHFTDPGDAVFNILIEHRELQPHGDLRRELLSRTLQAAMDDPRPPVPGDEVFARLKAKFSEPLPEPATWVRRR